MDLNSAAGVACYIFVVRCPFVVYVSCWYPVLPGLRARGCHSRACSPLAPVFPASSMVACCCFSDAEASAQFCYCRNYCYCPLTWSAARSSSFTTVVYDCTPTWQTTQHTISKLALSVTLSVLVQTNGNLPFPAWNNNTQSKGQRGTAKQTAKLLCCQVDKRW